MTGRCLRRTVTDDATAKSAESPAPADNGGLQEVIVTANKRSENLQDIGAGISAVTSQQLDTLQANSLQDYLQLVPGVALQSFGAPGYGSVEIRGIAPQSVGATVATYIDNIPIGGSSSFAAGGEYTPDVDPADLQRVEVLKGPQGTLYGASSLGGVIKYVMKQPSLTQTEGDISEEIEGVEHGGEGGRIRASYSTPVTTDFAIRVSGYYRRIPGYIDDVGIGGKDANDGTDWGLHGTVLWKPVHNLSIAINALTQQSKSNAYNVVDYDPVTMRPLYGNLKQDRFVPEFFAYKTDLLSAEISYDTSYGSILSATSYSTTKATQASDVTVDLEGFGDVGPTHPVDDSNESSDQQETQEIRFTSNRLGNVEFLAGMFLQHELLRYGGEYVGYLADGHAVDPNAPLYGADAREATLDEEAGFVNTTYYILPKLDVTLGYRYSHISQDQNHSTQGLLYEGDTTTVATTHYTTSEDSNTYLAGARWRMTDDVMVYARAASGYRPGGTRSVLPGAPAGFSTSYNSDSIWSYESGVKARALDGRLTFDADAFWITWTNIQTLVTIGRFDTDGNGGKATSRGIELQSSYVPFLGLTLSVNASYTDAFFNETDPSVQVVKGQRLFFVPKLAGNVSANYMWQLDRFQPNVGADWSYTDSEFDITNHSLPSYFILNLHAGLKWNACNVNLFVKNALDKHAIIGDLGFYAGLPPYQATINQPLTVGVQLSQHF